MSEAWKEIKQTPPQMAEKPNLFLEEMASRVRQFSSSELKRIGEDRPEYVRERVRKRLEDKFPADLSFEINGRIYGVTYNEGVRPLDLTVVKAFIYQLDVAASRFPTIEGCDPYTYSGKQLPIFVDRGSVGLFQFYNSFQIRVGRDDIEDLAKFPKDYKDISMQIQGCAFHEFMHMLRVDLCLNNMIPKGSARELVSQLGEFLYNPKENKMANDMFKKFIEGFRKGEKIGYHGNDWITMARILLWEYRQLTPSFSIPESREAQIDLISKLDSVYAGMPPKQRDEIIKKYVVLSDEEIEKRSAACSKELNLKF
ncbi:MAG: hypothetical protein NT130_01015 [Candidatus Micrarchaeota archaeon]|nr:hypothetical protein [Candidatus Micrarchaeota archaeon]